MPGPAEEAVALLAPVAAAADFLQARRVAGLSLRVIDVHLRLFRGNGTAMSDAAVEQALGQGQGGSGSGVLARPLVDPLRLPPAGGPTCSAGMPSGSFRQRRAMARSSAGSGRATAWSAGKFFPLVSYGCSSAGPPSPLPPVASARHAGAGAVPARRWVVTD